MAADWRTYLLRIVFALGAGWAVLLAFSDILFADLPDDRFRPLIEALIILAVAAAGGVLTFLISKAWASFLRVPETVGVSELLGRWLGSVVASCVLIGALFAALEYVDLRLHGDPDNPQYGLSVVVAALWYPAMLAPVVSILTAWLWVRRCSRRRSP